MLIGLNILWLCYVGCPAKTYFSPHAEYSFTINTKLRNINLSLKISAAKEMFKIESNPFKAIFYPIVVLLIFSIISTLSFYLIRSRSLLREALNHAKETRKAVDESIIYAKTDTKGIILEVNSKFESISGYSRDELIGQDHRILNSGTHSKKFFKELWKTILRGNVWRGEIQNRSKSGKLYWVDTSIIPLRDSKGSVVAFSALRTEITDKKEVEFKLHQSQSKAVRALETKTRFLANMSHEIRTPMNGIIGLTEVLKGHAKEHNQLETIHSIQKSGLMLLKIIDDILDFSKLEAGKVELEIISIDLRKELTQIVELLLEKASENGTIISHNFDEDISNWIYADPIRIRQIVMNLLSNAIKFTHNGSIEVKVVKEVIDSEPFVKISVKDSGIGIPLHQQEKLFQSFSQVDASTTRKFGGTGLGLSICKGLVGVMGGQLWLNSTPDVGSIFYFTFPYKESNEVPVWDLDQNEDDIQIDPSISILIAEDNPINRRVIEGYLASLACHADYATNGKEAVSMSNSKKYDLIFMDCNMPEMDGFEATREIKAMVNPPRIVALTASAMAEDKEKCKLAGMDGFLSKPISKSQLKKAILNTHEQQFTSSANEIATHDFVNCSVINRIALEEAFGENHKLLLDTLELIGEQNILMVGKLRNAHEEKDREQLMGTVHTLKGVLANIYAERSVAMLNDFEQRIDKLADKEIEKLLENIISEINDLNLEIVKFVKKDSAAA